MLGELTESSAGLDQSDKEGNTDRQLNFKSALSAQKACFNFREYFLIVFCLFSSVSLCLFWQLRIWKYVSWVLASMSDNFHFCLFFKSDFQFKFSILIVWKSVSWELAGRQVCHRLPQTAVHLFFPSDTTLS